MLARRVPILALALLTMGCTMAGPEQQQTNYVSVTAAVAYRDEAGVRALLDAGRPPDERDDVQATPLITAAASDQFRIAELLLQHGADPFAFDRFGVTAAEFVATSREPDDTPDGQARLRIMQRMKEVGVPVPPPPRDHILALAAAGRWGRKR